MSGPPASPGRLVDRLRASAGLLIGLILFLGWLVFTVFRTEPPKPLNPERAARVAAKVLPKDGYTLPLRWDDLGVKLVRGRVIDLEKFRHLYTEDGLPPPEFSRLTEPSTALITITLDNAPFLVNVFWALGLANKSPVLEQIRNRDGLMTLASTGGWTLGARPASELYGKVDLIRLTAAQEALVSDLARNIYRPCCDNPTALPDCNHGMALLAVIELMAANGFGREDILRAALKFNAFWFPEQYVATALLFQLRGTDWDAVNPVEVLGSRYSSLSGWRQHVEEELRRLRQSVPPLPGAASCRIPATSGGAASPAQPPTLSPTRHEPSRPGDAYASGPMK